LHDATGNTIGISVNAGTVNTTSFSGGIFDGTTAFLIGSRSGATYMNGRIDEVGVWKKLLSASELTELYNSGAGKTCCPF
jgi:hypothetical protein